MIFWWPLARDCSSSAFPARPAQVLKHIQAAQEPIAASRLCPVPSPGMTDNDSEPQQISWVPVLDQTGDDPEPMRLIPFGIARHTGDGVPVPEAGGALIDRDIAELVALLNRAGVRTMQSCHDIGDGCELGPLVATGDEDDDNWYMWIDLAGGEAARFGCVVVEWDQFPALGAVLPRYYESGNNSGWLVSVHRDLRLDKWYVSVLFPWSDLAEWTAALKDAIARQG